MPFHAGSLEALRVTRPEAVGLERTNSDPNGARITDTIGFHGLAASHATSILYAWIYYLSSLDPFLGFRPWRSSAGGRASVGA